MSTNNIPSGITQDMIDVAISNPGVAVSNGDLATARTPVNNISIRGAGKDLRPNVAGNRPQEGLVDGPSPKFSKGLASSAQADAAAQLKLLEDRQKEKESLSNQALRRDVEAMRRAVKRLEKQVKDLTNAIPKEKAN